MRRAIARDFAAVPGVRVVVTLDDRFPDEPGPWSIVRIGAGEEESAFPRLVALADYTALIAPETGGILAGRARAIEHAAGRSLGSTPAAIELTGDKLRLGRHLADRGIATPDCLRITPRTGLPVHFPYPAVLKPIDGAGAQETYLVEGADACPEAARELPVALLQPMVPGVSASACFLVGPDGKARLIAAGWQHVEICDGRFVYCGGTIPVPPRGVEGGPRQAIESVAGLCGFVGVDYVWDDVAKCATVIEINPRPTTSYVGLVRGLSPGILAGCWLQVVSGAGRLGPGPLFPGIDLDRPVTFAADGAMIESDEGAPP
jgi:predicted ATP-grasp superfamily ATP-dependent carboligase